MHVGLHISTQGPQGWGHLNQGRAGCSVSTIPRWNPVTLLPHPSGQSGLGAMKTPHCALRAAVCRSLASLSRVKSPQHRTSMWEESKKGMFLQEAVYSGWIPEKKTKTEDISARRTGWRQATQSGRRSRRKFSAGVDVKTPGWEKRAWLCVLSKQWPPWAWHQTGAAGGLWCPGHGGDERLQDCLGAAV